MTQTPQQPSPAQPPYKQLRRPTTDRMIAGVASGIGRYFNVDPTLVRVIFAVVGLATGGLALLAYPVIWFLMPEEPDNAPPWPHPTPTAPPAAGQSAPGPYPPAWSKPANMRPEANPANLPPEATPAGTPPAA